MLAGLKTCKHRCCTVFISVALSSRKNVLGNFPIIAFCTWKRLVIFRACLFFKGTLYHHVRKYSFHAHFWLTWFLQSSKKLRSPDFPQKKKELRAIPVGSPFKMKGKTAFSIRLFDFCNHIEKRKCLEILVSWVFEWGETFDLAYQQTKSCQTRERYKAITVQESKWKPILKNKSVAQIINES